MSDSLRDQLVKAGLATSAQAKKAERQVETEKHAKRRGKSGKPEKGRPEKGRPEKKDSPPGQKQIRKDTGGPESPAKETAAKEKQGKESSANDTSAESSRARAQKRLAEKRAQDKARGQVANQKQAERNLRAAMRQLIFANDQRVKTTSDDDVPYNFVHNKKIKRIYVPKAQVEQLSKGTLVIVNNDGRYHLVSKEVAEKIRARDPKRIIAAHDDKKPEPGSDDEFYAKFEVPDDLDW